jgi:hypothetical protein
MIHRLRDSCPTALEMVSSKVVAARVHQAALLIDGRTIQNVGLA